MNIFKQSKKTFFIVILGFFSIFFNQYYGNLGLQPIDSFFPFNSGYDVLNGFYPFKDYWTITGPLIDVVQAFFFKIFGVSWFSYVFHASIFNLIFIIYFFNVLKKLNLDINYCFIYALALSILAYPSSGTPYVDHQSSYLSTMSILCFIIAINFKSKLYWFLLPILLGLSFLTKQTPTGYIFIIISMLSIYYLFFHFNIKPIIMGLSGSILIVLIFFLFIFLGKIPLNSFINQYIFFPMSFGETRLGEGFLFPLEFQRLFLRFKLIHLSWIPLAFIIFRNCKINLKYLISVEFITLISLILLAFSMVAHQLMTINGIYIYFLIPVLLSFSQIYFQKYFKKDYLNIYFFMTLIFCSTIYYGYKYVNKRNFMDLNNADISKSVGAEVFDEKLIGLKWITPQYPNTPIEEISNLKKAIEIIKNDTSKKIIVTDYQFISVILSTYDNSPNKVWYSFHVYPTKNDAYFDLYQNFFKEKIKDLNIQTVYTVKPLYGDDDVLKDILPNECREKVFLTNILEKQIIKKKCIE